MMDQAQPKVILVKVQPLKLKLLTEAVLRLMKNH